MPRGYSGEENTGEPLDEGVVNPFVPPYVVPPDTLGWIERLHWVLAVVDAGS